MNDEAQLKVEKPLTDRITFLEKLVQQHEERISALENRMPPTASTPDGRDGKLNAKLEKLLDELAASE